MERIPGRPVLVALIDPRGRVLIPLRPVAEQAGIPLRSAAGRIGLEWPAGIWETEVDPAEGTVRVGAEAPRPLPEGSWRSVNGELYLIASALESILDATVAVRWSDLMVLVTGTGRFPAARRVEREAERDRARGDSGYGPEPHATVPFLGRTSGASATWGVAMAESAGEIRGSARMALGGSVLGGGTEIGGTLGVGARKSSGGGDFFARFSRQVHGTEWLRRVELGSVLSGGTVSRSMVGATLTNEPHTQPRYFGDAAIRPSVPVGWEYEVYQGGNLVGVSGGEADSEVRAPLNYGNTPVTVRLIGPAGQEIVEDLLYVVSPRQIPSGRWRYDVGAGVCRDARCGNYGYGELRYGLLSWLTLGGGADRLVGMSTGEVDARAFGSLVMRPLPNLSTDLQLQPGAFLQANTRLLTSATGSVSASYTWNRPREGEVSWNGWQGQLSRTGRLPMSGSRTITARLLLRGRERDRVDSWRASVAAPVGGSFVMVDFESGLQVDRLVSARASTPLGAPRAWLADLAVHASASATARRIERMEAGTSFRPVPWGSLQAGIRIRPEEAPQLTLAFVTRSRAGFAQSRAVAGSRSSVSASMDGGVALREGLADPVLLPSRGIGHSGVHGVVFHDLNGNGIRDAGEPVAAGVTVGVQGRRTETDAKGRYRAWDVRPYEPVAIGVDSLTLDFGWTPGPREVVIRPSPNVFNRVDLALVRTREAVGRVEGPGGRRLGGVTVEVVDGDGVVVVTGRTYSDGELYLQRVPPGRFLVRAAESSTRALGLCGPPVEATLPFDGDHLLELPTLHLERRC